jgi:hypothetical protein
MNNLDFLDNFINPKENEYEEPLFVKSNFLDDVWTIEYSDKKNSVIDFKVKMGDGLYLTDPKHNKTLNTLKYWIIFHTLDNENYRKSKSIMAESIFAILTFFDAFNIHKNDTNIEKYGFEYLSENHFKYILDLIANSNDKFLSVYQLRERVLESYLKKAKIAFIGKVNESNIDNWIDFNNYYADISLKDLYPDTILKPVKKPTIKNIEIAKVRITQEYENILQDDDEESETRSLLSTRVFKNVLISLRKLHKFINKFQNPISLPNKNTLDNIEHFNVDYKNKGRFKTVPSNIIFSYVKNAIEFHYKYGEDIVETYTLFYQVLKQNNYNFNSFKYTEELNNIFLECLKPNLKEAGVISIKSENNKLYDGKERFNILRKNNYFYDLIKVYYGAVQVVIGALMARRQSELASLIVGECIDEHSSSLIFKQSKSTKGVFGTKNTLHLPIDPLGIEMIKNLEKMHIKGNGDALFSIPQIKNIFTFKSSIDNTTYAENIDFFIDYIQGELKDGKRYYIRQHQLRRFFAMCFFWGSGFGSLDTLRWFMGHTDVQHVYHYITESTSGEVLRNVKTQFLLENVEKYENLLSLIKNKYNTEQFDLIDSEDLELYINDLLENEEIVVEPEFMQDNTQENYKIIVKIKGEDYV